MTKRLFIFASYDKFQRVDDTLIYYLNALSQLGDIVFYMDNDLQNNEIDKIKSIPNVLYARAKRHGEYDFGSYKRGYIWTRDNNLLSDYDWVYLVNDSVLGPVAPLKPIVQKLETSGADFTGMVGCTVPNSPHHVQSWFIGMKADIVKSNIFNDFITNISQESDKTTIVYKYEMRLTQMLLQNGYKYTTVFQDSNANIYNNAAKVLEQGVPFIKKLSFDNTKIIKLYPFIPKQVVKLIINYINKYDINWDKKGIWDTSYSKTFRFTIFGLPVVSAKQKTVQHNIAYKIYLFDVIPICKIFLTKKTDNE